MAEPRKVFKTSNFMGFTNVKCEAFPCHDVSTFKNLKDSPETEFNCLFCFCPLVFLECPGPYIVFKDANGFTRKDCSNCALPHDGIFKGWNFIQRWLEKPKPWGGK